METPWIQRIRMIICSIFGHWESKSWIHEGNKVIQCRTCKCTINLSVRADRMGLLKMENGENFIPCTVEVDE